MENLYILPTPFFEQKRISLPIFFWGLTILSLFMIPLSAGEIPSALTLPQAIDLALEQHPEIRSAEAKVKSGEGLVRQAGLRPNPNFSFQIENWRFYGDPALQPGRDMDWFAYLTQPIETGSKRRLRVELSRAESARHQWDKQVLIWRIRQTIKQSFWKALAAQKELDLATTLQSDFQSVLEYHQHRFEQGAMAEADLIKVRLEGERLDLARQNALMNSEQARIELMKAMALPGVSSSWQLIAPEFTVLPSEGISRKDLLERASKNRGEIRALQLQQEEVESRLSLQKAQTKPDLEAILGYKRTEGWNTLLAGISIPIPFFNRNQGNLFAGRQEILQIREQSRAASLQAEKEIEQAITALRRRRLMLRQLQKGMIERAEESWKIALAAYQEGGSDLLRLLDAQRSRQEIRLLHHRTQIDFQLSLIDLENAVGEENLPIGENTMEMSRP